MGNQFVNRVDINGRSVIDLTNDTVNPDTLVQGYTAHDKSGAPIVGRHVDTGITPSGNIEIDENGTYDVTEYASATVNVDGSAVSIEPLTVTENGIYTASSGKAYSPITVNVSGSNERNIVISASAMLIPVLFAPDVNIDITQRNNINVAVSATLK